MNIFQRVQAAEPCLVKSKQGSGWWGWTHVTRQQRRFMYQGRSRSWHFRAKHIPLVQMSASWGDNLTRSMSGADVSENIPPFGEVPDFS